MDEGTLQVLEILIFAGIAGFLVLRLRSVLGRRTGLERRPDALAPKPLAPSTPPPVPPRAVSAPAAAGNGVDAIKAADPGFDAAAFLAGARSAFEIIVNAFAAGDTAALKPLLSAEVYGRFAEAIAARQAAKETLQTTLTAIRSAEIVASSLENATALVTVKFVSDQTNVSRAADGKVVDGDPDRVTEHVDFWTFARVVRSRDPNWTLVTTHSQ